MALSEEQKVTIPQLPESTAQGTDYFLAAKANGQIYRGSIQDIMDSVQLQIEDEGIVKSLVDQTKELRDQAIAAAGGVSAPKGTYNAATGVATIITNGVVTTFSPTDVSDKPNGTMLVVTTPGSQSISIPPNQLNPASVNMEIDGSIVTIGGKWAYVPKNSVALENLNGVKISDTGKATGVVIPELQFRHIRGESEMLGNNVWAVHKGIIQYEQLGESVSFNRLRIPFSLVSPSEVVVRIYKSNSLELNPSNMTLLSEKIIPSGQFNLLSTSFQVVDLNTIIRVKGGEFLYVAVFTDVVNILRVTRWSTQSGVNPLRHSFLYTSSANQWASVWTETNVGSGFAQSSFDLYQINLSQDLVNLKSKIDSDLSGVKIDQSSAYQIFGTALPEYQHIHPDRGVSEVYGNATYAPSSNVKGVGIYDLTIKPATFNRIVCRVFADALTPVTVKVFKSKTFTNVIGSMTEISSLSFGAGILNSQPLENTVINLPSYVHVEEGTYVYIFFYSDQDVKIGTRYWNVLAGSGTERYRFFTMVSGNPSYNDPFNASAYWGPTSAVFYSTSLALVDSKVGDLASFTSKIKKNDGSLRDSFIPVLQYDHVRGETEILGGTTFGAAGYYGVGLVQQILEGVVFNKVDLSVSSAKDTGIITMRIYRGLGINDSPASMSLLYSEDFQSGLFNKDPLSFSSFLLNNPVKAGAGEYIHIYFHTTVDNSLRLRAWGLDGTNPARNRFKFKSNSTPWDVAWSSSSASLYGTSFRLSMVDVFAEKKINSAIQDNPRICIPSKVYAVVGFPLSVYYDAIVLGKDLGLQSPSNYNVIITCGKGIIKDRYWRHTPVSGDIGTHSMVVSVYNEKWKLLSSKSISLIIVSSAKPVTQKYIIDEGDSTVADTNSRVAMNENFALVGSGITPLFLGSAGSGDTKSEAWGGSMFIGHISQNMVITGGSRANSLWNPGTNQIDISYYKNTVLSHSGSINIVSIQLGINDSRGSIKSESDMLLIIEQAKTLVSAWLSLDGSIRVIVQLPLTSINVNWGGDKATYSQNIWRLRELVISTFDNSAFDARVFVGQAGVCVDRYFGYRIASAAVGSRYPELEITHTDNVHPRTEGYKEMGDAKFAQILALIQ